MLYVWILVLDSLTVDNFETKSKQSVLKCSFDAEDLLTVTLHVCILILDSRIILKPNHNCLMVETLT